MLSVLDSNSLFSVVTVAFVFNDFGKVLKRNIVFFFSYLDNCYVDKVPDPTWRRLVLFCIISCVSYTLL